MCGYPQFSFWISIILVKIYSSSKIINRGQNTFELVGTVLNFSHCYLSGRKKKRVKVNRVFSGWLPVYCGVPQGSYSLLGPLQFNIFINDLNLSIQVSSLRLYADDTTAYPSNSNVSVWNCLITKILRSFHPGWPLIPKQF